MSNETTKLGQTVMARIGVAGQGEALAAWSRAIRGCDGVDVRRLSAAPDDLVNELSAEDLDAIAFISPLRDLAAMVKRAIIARKHVLVVSGIADSHQLILLDELARRRERVLLFDGCGFADEAMTVARRITQGDHPMRRPRFLRGLRICGTTDVFEDATQNALSRLLAIAGEQPSQVSAFAPRFDDDDNGGPRLVHISLAFPSGLAATLDVSAIEPELRDELTVVCHGRTLVLDALSTRTPLRVLTPVRQNDANKVAEHFGSRAEHQSAEAQPAPERVSTAFVEAILGNESLCNAREFATSALVWETARASMARGGEFTALAVNHPLVATSRPSLQLIEGGGNTTEATSVPRLRLVQGGRRAQPMAPPPRSA